MDRSSEESNENRSENRWNRIDNGHEFMSQISNTSGCEPVVGDLYRDPYVMCGQPFVTCEGYISLLLSHNIRLDISANHSIRVSTPQSIAAINHFAKNIGIIHPFGHVFQESDSLSCCHIESGNHLAKMCSRGVTFTSLNRSLIYLVDNSGCKTTTERFRKLNYDFTSDVFHLDDLSGDHARQRAIADILRGSYKMLEQGRDQMWQLAGIRVRQKSWGEVIVSKSFGKIAIDVMPKKRFMRVSSPTLKVVVSDDSDCLLKVIKPDPKNEQRVTVSSNHFKVKNGSQKAGFDSKDQLVLM